MRVGRREEARAAEIDINTTEEKRGAATLALHILRNSVAFVGFASSIGNRTYGILNDPNLPAYDSVAPTVPGGDTNWADKTFLQITADLREAFSALRSQSGSVVDPSRTPTTLGIASSAVDYLSVTSDYGNSVADWLKQTYPLNRTIAIPEFDGANAGENVFYLFADAVQDGSTDGGRTFDQIVPTLVQMLGSMQTTKGHEESYTNATAGVMLKRPYAVVRRFGI